MYVRWFFKVTFSLLMFEVLMENLEWDIYYQYAILYCSFYF